MNLYKHAPEVETEYFAKEKENEPSAFTHAVMFTSAAIIIGLAVAAMAYTVVNVVAIIHTIINS